MDNNRQLKINDLATELGIDAPAIRRWVKQGCPCDKPLVKNKPILFNRLEIAKWMESNNLNGKVGRPRSESSQEKLQFEISILRSKDKLAKMDVAERAGSLVSKQNIENDIINKCLYIKHGLLAFINSLSPQLVGLTEMEIRKLLDKRVGQLLTYFSSGKVSFDVAFTDDEIANLKV